MSGETLQKGTIRYAVVRAEALIGELESASRRTSLAAWALEWGTSAEGAIVLVDAIYMLGVTFMHGSELRHSADEGGGRPGALVALVASSAALLYLGIV